MKKFDLILSDLITIALLPFNYEIVFDSNKLVKLIFVKLDSLIKDKTGFKCLIEEISYELSYSSVVIIIDRCCQMSSFMQVRDANNCFEPFFLLVLKQVKTFPQMQLFLII
jgi:hypothetical protein